MGASLSNPIELTRVQRHGSSAFRVAAAEMQGWRGNHEDAHEIRCNDTVGQFWVLDGHGGDEAALAGAPRLGKEFDADLSKGFLLDEDRLGEGMIVTDKFLNEKLIESGCTVTGAMAKKEADGTYTVKLINAGDSRGIIIRSHTENEGSAKKITVSTPGHLEELAKNPAQVAKQNAPGPCSWPLVQESIDHKPSHPTEVARIEAAGGHVTDDDPPRLDGNLAVSRGLGDFEYKQSTTLEPGKQKVSCVPDVYEARGLEPGSCIILCCDGVYDVHSSDDIANLVYDELKETPEKDLGDIAAKIIRNSLDKNSSDNITAMVVQLGPGTKWEGQKAPLDEMRCFQGMLKDNQESDVKLKSKSILRKWNFAEDPVPCAKCGKWVQDTPYCPCEQAHYCSRHCQKVDWKRHKVECKAKK